MFSDRQQQFQEQVDQVTALGALNDDHRGNQLLRRLISHLLREGEKVVESHQRMSTNLRRVLDTTHLNERRQVGELLQAIRNAALKLRDAAPEGDRFSKGKWLQLPRGNWRVAPCLDKKDLGGRILRRVIMFFRKGNQSYHAKILARIIRQSGIPKTEWIKWGGGG